MAFANTDVEIHAAFWNIDLQCMMQVPSFCYKACQGWKTGRGSGCCYTALEGPKGKDRVA